MPSNPEKAALRETILREFREISPADRQTRSERLADRLFALPELVGEPKAVMAFLSMADELDTDPLLRRALEVGHRVFCPRTLRRGRRLVPTRLPSLDSITIGAYGIREPSGEEVIEPEELDLVIVPAVAFDRQGGRLGRGGGYYDRFLERLKPEAVTCGVVFTRHLFDRVPTEPHDCPVQMIVTEAEVVRVSRSTSPE